MSRRGTVPGALLAAAVLAVAGLVFAAPPVSTARFVDTEQSGGTISTELLDPPTALAATASGDTVSLTWTPSTDAARATGYTILRGVASGGPYTQVGSVSPGTATGATDMPGAGTSYYVLRTTAATNWSSVDSNEASVTVSAALSTGTKDCASQAADSGGDGNGYEGSPAAMCADDGVESADVNSGTGSATSCTSPQKDRHQTWGYAFGLPGSVSSITAVAVNLDARLDSTGGSTNKVCVELSWDGGTSWTAAQSIEITATTEQTYTLSGTWGRTWSVGELGAAVFRVRITDVSNNQNRDFFLDRAGVSVSYLP